MSTMASRPITRLQLLQRAARPHLCPRDRSRYLFRTVVTNTSPSGPAHTTRTRRIPYRYIWYLVALGIGTGAGLAVRAFATSRLNAPAPGSQEDTIALAALADQMDELDIVKAMRARAYELNPDALLNEGGRSKGGWLELDIQDSVAESATKGAKGIRTLTQQAMVGIQGLGVQRAFWNSETQELVAVIWIGPRLSGWPGIAHGGAIATIFEEVMSRMIAGPNISIDSIPTPASMSVTYARPTLSFNMYILRTSFSTPDLPQEAPPPEPAPAKSWLPYWKDFTKLWTSTAPESPVEVRGTLESLDGEVKVRAKGTWPASAVKRSDD